MLRIASVSVDRRDVHTVTRYWSAALGYVITQETDDDGTVEDPKGRDVELVSSEYQQERP
ncbi:MAG TPA: hypothetical protein VG815_11195 [Chloroflexota bacterium]|jgi:hypothetical protein|nr:hypothetical protein [Chloroflexota bacterium]